MSRRTSKRRTSRKPARRRTSRGIKRNPVCPACGSPHYFEGLTTRDCATPDCRYYAGGSVSGEESAQRPTGRRSILVTYDITTPESAEHGDYADSGEKFERTIDAEDLDEDESWAEYAVKFLRDELGGVEDNGDGSYYQYEGSIDYSDGSEERLAAHLKPREAWADDLDEIAELLKLQPNRGVRRNPIPPRPSGPSYDAWARKTFAKGTHVRVLQQPRRTGFYPDEEKKHGIELIQVGERGVITQVGNMIPQNLLPSLLRSVHSPSAHYIVTGERHAPMLFSSDKVPVSGLFFATQLAEYLEPLDDNWGSGFVPYRPSSAARPRKTTSRRVRPNPVPPPPTDPASYRAWLATTFHPGDPVVLLREYSGLAHDENTDPQQVNLPAGTRGTVHIDDRGYVPIATVWFDHDVPLLFSVEPSDDGVYVRSPPAKYHSSRIEDWIRPVVDNWGASYTPYKPSSAARPRKTTSRRPRQNPVPPPPPDTTSRHFHTWVVRTFPIGSTFRWGSGSNSLCRVDDVTPLAIPGYLGYSMVRGVRDKFGALIGGPGTEGALDAIHTPGNMSISFDDLLAKYLSGEIRPDDHWAPFQHHVPLHRTMASKRMKPNRTSRRRTSRRR